MRFLVAVWAQMDAAKLPGRPLLSLGGEPMLAVQLRRIRSAKSEFELVVVTSYVEADRPIRALCRDLGVHCVADHPTDRLEVLWRTATDAGADWIATIPGDCPLIDPRAIDRVLGFVREDFDHYDFFTNRLPPTWPDGNDIEVTSLSSLYSAWREATTPLERQHPMTFVRDRPDRFRIASVAWETGLDYSLSHRVRVEEPSDYALAQEICAELLAVRGMTVSALDIARWLDARPEHREAAAGAGCNERTALRTMSAAGMTPTTVPPAAARPLQRSMPATDGQQCGGLDA